MDCRLLFFSDNAHDTPDTFWLALPMLSLLMLPVLPLVWAAPTDWAEYCRPALLAGIQRPCGRRHQQGVHPCTRDTAGVVVSTA